LKVQKDAGTLAEVAKSLNARQPGVRTQVMKTGRRLDGSPLSKADLIAAIPLWDEPETWATIRGGIHPLASYNLLNALDLRWSASGSLEVVAAGQAVFLQGFGRTFLVAANGALATLALGFP